MVTEVDADRRIDTIIANAKRQLAYQSFSQHDLDEAWKALEGGKQFDDFTRFWYNDLESWKTFVESEPYRHLHKALAEA